MGAWSGFVVLAAGLLMATGMASGVASASSGAGAGAPLTRSGAIVIGHRGASAERPEHTLAAYARAIEAGADYVEPDLVATRDGVLVARHENEISGTTDVADHPEFASRRTTRTIDGEQITGWFTEDFTLAELKTLKARERLPQLRPANAAYDGQFTIPTLQEVIDLVRAAEKRTGRVIGIYPETKHPSHFAGIGLALEPRLLAVLNANGYTGSDAPVFIQSFEIANLKALRTQTALPLIFLMSDEGAPADTILTGRPRPYASLLTPEGLAEIASFANGIGVDKTLVLARDAAGRTTGPTGLVARAHAAGLKVHVYTLRPENHFLPLERRRGEPQDPGYPAQRGDAAGEVADFLAAGVDGLFCDDPASAVAVRDAAASVR